MTQDPFGLNVRAPLSMKFVQPNRERLVVLELIDDEPDPDYCVYGRTRCFRCDRWCYLGQQTIEAVESGEAMPFCKSCATPLVQDANLVNHLDDHQPNI